MIIGPTTRRDLPQALNGPVALRAVHAVPVDTKQRGLPPLLAPLQAPERALTESPARKAARARLARIKAGKAPSRKVCTWLALQGIEILNLHRNDNCAREALIRAERAYK